MGGFEICRRIMASDFPYKPAVIFLSGDGDPGMIAWIHDEKLTIALEDDGPGIPEKLKTRIMQPFFTTKPVGNGTGLGLPICIGIIEDHGGTLRLENRAEVVCRAMIELPVHRDQEHAASGRDDGTTRIDDASSEMAEAAFARPAAE